MRLPGGLRSRRRRNAFACWAALAAFALSPFLPARSAGQSRSEQEPEALVTFFRDYRRQIASDFIDEVVAWADTVNRELPLDLQDRLALLDSGSRTATVGLDDLALSAALIHSLGMETDLRDDGFDDRLHAAAAALAQELVFRLRDEPHPAGVSMDSLRARGEASRLPDPAGIGNVSAITPPPFFARNGKVLLERADRFNLTPPDGPVDWFRWVPGSDEIILRGGGMLYRAAPTNLIDTLGFGGASDDPEPALSASGEYVAAVGRHGELRLLRMGVASRPWWSPEPYIRLTALAFSPTELEVAFSDAAGAIHLHDLDRAITRHLADGAGRVAALHWSPNGHAIAWDTVDSLGVHYRAGSVDTRWDRTATPTPDEASLDLAGPPQWAPDGKSVLALGSFDGRTAFWQWGSGRFVELIALEPGNPAELLTSPDFQRAALVAATGPHPEPWGYDATAPFTYDARPAVIVALTWPGGDDQPVFDLPQHRTPGLDWNRSSRFLIRRFDERVETIEAGHPPKARQGLGTWDLHTGEEIPLTPRAGDYRYPRLSARESWLLYLEVTGDDPVPAGTLWAREMNWSAGSETLAERAHLRALPLARRGEPRALGLLRDALRLDPDRESARHELGRVSLEMAAKAASAAETGLLLGAAVRELTLVYAQDPGNPIYRRDLVESFIAYSVLAGRFYAAEAASRARTFLEADAEAVSDPETVRTVLHPALIDAVLWDPRQPDGWELLRNGLRHYR